MVLRAMSLQDVVHHGLRLREQVVDAVVNGEHGDLRGLLSRIASLSPSAELLAQTGLGCSR